MKIISKYKGKDITLKLKGKYIIGIILLIIGTLGLIIGFSFAIVDLLTNPDISMALKIIISSTLLFIAGFIILNDDE